jgi:hypothetical protein
MDYNGKILMVNTKEKSIRRTWENMRDGMLEFGVPFITFIANEALARVDRQDVKYTYIAMNQISRTPAKVFTKKTCLTGIPVTDPGIQVCLNCLDEVDWELIKDNNSDAAQDNSAEIGILPTPSRKETIDKAHRHGTIQTPYVPAAPCAEENITCKQCGQSVGEMLESTGQGSSNSSEDNQSIKADFGKTNFLLVPPKAIEGIAVVRKYGVEKYGQDSWREVEPERFLAAALRHLDQYRRGEEYDEESGSPHIDHALTNLALLREMDYTPRSWDDLTCKDS